MPSLRRRLASLVLGVAALTMTAAPSDAIVGGRNASQGEYPWMAALYLLSPDSGQYCGGTLVAPRVVVSAAHCVLGLPAPGVTGVLLGRNTLSGSGGEQIPVAAVIPHPAFVFGVYANDVVVVLLSRASVQQPLPIARPGQESYWAAGVTTTITGWGATKEGGDGSDALREANVPVVSDSQCAAWYGPTIVGALHLCAGYPRGGTDTCQGDSGGPLMVPGPGSKFILAGITSFGEGCARKERPGVYTEVGAQSVSNFILPFTVAQA